MRAYIRFSLILCLFATLVPSGIASAVEGDTRNWIDSPLYHRFVSKPDDADGCVHEQWTIRTDPLYSYEPREYLPQDVCAYHAKDYVYATFGRMRTVLNTGSRTLESGLAVANGNESKNNILSPVEWSDNLARNHVPMGASVAFGYRAPANTGSSYGLQIISNFPDKLSKNPINSYYQLEDYGQQLLSDDNAPAYFYGLGVSSNGQWLVGVQYNRLLRYDLTSMSVDNIANKFFYSTAIWPTPGYSMGVSDDGKYVVALGFNARSYLIEVHSTCVGPAAAPTWQSDTALYSNCKYREIDSLTSRFSQPFSQSSGGAIAYGRTEINGRSSITYSDSHQIWHEISYKNFSGVQYLALGDSFASGEGDITSDGTDPFLFGTNVYGDYSTGLPREMCHISRRSYPLLILDTMNLERGSDAHSVACSGAVVSDIYTGTAANGFVDGNYMGQYTQSTDWNVMKPRLQGIANAARLKDEARTNVSPGRVQQIEHLKKTQPYYATIMAGGNDMRFGDVMVECALNISLGINRPCKYATPEGRKEQAAVTYSNYKNLLDLYKTALAASPNTKFFVVGYPQFFDAGSQFCLETLGAYTPAERQSLYELTDYANATIRAAANDAGITYLDISGALRGQELCGKTNGMTGVDNLIGAKIYTELMHTQNTVLDQSIFDRVLHPTKTFLNAYEINRGFAQANKFAYSPYTAIYGAMQQFSHPNAVGHDAIFRWIMNYTDGELLATENCNHVVACPSGVVSGPPSPAGYVGGLTLDDGEIINGEGIVSVGRKSGEGSAHGVVVLQKAGKMIISVPSTKIMTLAGGPAIRATLHSEPVQLGEAAYNELTDAYELQTQLHDSVPIGRHTIYVQGVNREGGKVSYVRDVFVEGPQGDVDGDGVEDSVDVCAYLSQNEPSADISCRLSRKEEVGINQEMLGVSRLVVLHGARSNRDEQTGNDLALNQFTSDTPLTETPYPGLASLRGKAVSSQASIGTRSSASYSPAIATLAGLILSVTFVIIVRKIARRTSG